MRSTFYRLMGIITALGALGVVGGMERFWISISSGIIWIVILCITSMLLLLKSEKKVCCSDANQSSRHHAIKRDVMNNIIVSNEEGEVNEHFKI